MLKNWRRDIAGTVLFSFDFVPFEFDTYERETC